MTETRFYEPARLRTPNKPLFSLKPLDATTWLRSLLSKSSLYLWEIKSGRLTTLRASTSQGLHEQQYGFVYVPRSVKSIKNCEMRSVVIRSYPRDITVQPTADAKAKRTRSSRLYLKALGHEDNCSVDIRTSSLFWL